jgi:hypothetical protein
LQPRLNPLLDVAVDGQSAITQGALNIFMSLGKSYLVMKQFKVFFVYQKHIRTITMIDRKFIATSNRDPNMVITCGAINDLFVAEGEW